jgi:hypothetical protein
MQLWILLHKPSNSIKELNKTVIIEHTLFLFLRLGLLFLHVTLGTEFQSVKSYFAFTKEEIRIVRVKHQ